MCDRFDLIEQMAGIFYEQRTLVNVSLYVRKIAPTKTPEALAGLLDAGCPGATAVELLSHIDKAALKKDPTLASRIVTKCDERQQLSILREWLKARRRSTWRRAARRRWRCSARSRSSTFGAAL